MTQRLLAITAALALVLCAPSTEAALVTVNFSGTITSIDDPNGYISGSSVGDPFSGTLVYSTGLAAGVPGANPSIYTYLPSTTPAFAAPLGITVTVGSHTFSSSYTGLMQITVQNNLAGAYPDVFGAVADVNVGNTYTLAGIALGDSTGTALSSTDLPTSLDLSKFTVGDFNLVTPNGAGTNIFEGVINLNAVPEPSSLALAGIAILAGLGPWWASRLAARSSAEKEGHSGMASR